MKLTPAQQRLLTRAHQSDYNRDAPWADRNRRGFTELRECAEKYDRPFFGATMLHGSADFRVAYALEEKGLACMASNHITDSYWLIARVAA
jgi:hypothetical protein